MLPPLYGTGLNWGTFDKAGNYYVDTNYSNGPAEIFGVVRGGCKAKTIEFLQIGNAINSIGGITVLADGDIAIVDTFGPAIYIYKSPVNGSLGLPIRTVWLRGAADPLSFALTKHQSELFTADYGFAESQGYDFPAGGRPTTVIETPSEPVGVAVPL